MKRNFSGFFVVMIAAALMAGCAIKMPPAFTPQDLNPELSAGDMTQKAETFMVVLDASDSMAWRHDGIRKFDLAKDIVSRLNRTIPDLTLQSALRSLVTAPACHRKKRCCSNPWAITCGDTGKRAGTASLRWREQSPGTGPGCRGNGPSGWNRRYGPDRCQRRRGHA